ncbi:cytochrome oxidase [Candidatus Sulcia muelleri]|uniref:Cytochrome oxidase n=1 Tax=Candidatus Karelsulcia muelleri TaxID=336810 RepID=A0A3A1MKP2_9FLAO|nr:cytochrome oxidase [Candidatus Karelsulcia muelleri]
MIFFYKHYLLLINKLTIIQDIILLINFIYFIFIFIFVFTRSKKYYIDISNNLNF